MSQLPPDPYCTLTEGVSEGGSFALAKGQEGRRRRRLLTCKLWGTWQRRDGKMASSTFGIRKRTHRNRMQGQHEKERGHIKY